LRQCARNDLKSKIQVLCAGNDLNPLLGGGGGQKKLGEVCGISEERGLLAVFDLKSTIQVL
jgi:hypothetical protein